jgi:hypothetical protein
MNVKVYPTFAGQAFLIVLKKPAVGTQGLRPLIQNEAQYPTLNPLPGILKQVA